MYRAATLGRKLAARARVLRLRMSSSHGAVTAVLALLAIVVAVGVGYMVAAGGYLPERHVGGGALRARGGDGADLISELRAEMDQMRAEMRRDSAELAELRAEVAGRRHEVQRHEHEAHNS